MQVQLTIQSCICIHEQLLASLTPFETCCSTTATAQHGQDRGPDRLKVSIVVLRIGSQQRLPQRLVRFLPIGAGFTLRTPRSVYIDPIDQRIGKFVALEATHDE